MKQAEQVKKRIRKKRRRIWKKRIIAVSIFLIIIDFGLLANECLMPLEKLVTPVVAADRLENPATSFMAAENRLEKTTTPIVAADRLENPSTSVMTAKRSEPDKGDCDWNLVLVNSENYVPDNYEIELTELRNGERVNSKIYPCLQEMFDGARAEGIYPIVRDGYRTAEEQQGLLQDKIQVYMNEGYNQEKAEELAKLWVAVPGTSEHQLGIAVDINADSSRSISDDVYNWLANHSYQYGFIQRYPEGKTDITGIANEPWHYRYVGKEAAEEMYMSGMCLEEYLDARNG